VGGPAERSRSPAPTAEELVSRMTQRSTSVVETQAPAVESRPEPSMTASAEEPAATQAKEEALRTMCGSRTSGWSLPCVMSD
jgi:hypothetical protein